MSGPIVLDSNSLAVQYLRKKDKKLSRVIDMVGPITYKTKDDPYAFLVHEILEQMLSKKAGAKIYERLEILCNGEITPEFILQLDDEQIKSIGTSRSKVKYVKELSKAVISQQLIFSELDSLSDSEIIKELTSIKGIGNWTANMYLIFVLDRQDVLPITDIAFLQAYKWMFKTTDCSGEKVIAKCKKWKPYSSIAARYLYRALDMGFTKKEFRL